MLTKKCPDCEKTLKPTDMVCSCGYDFMMDDCPNCERRIEEGATVCPFCQYDLLGTGKPAAPKKEAAVEEEAPQRRTTVVRLSTVFVPAAATIEKWPEFQFKKEPTDENMLEWARKLRKAAELQGDRLTNHAIGYLAEYHDHKGLAKNWMRLRDLLGGDDYK